MSSFILNRFAVNTNCGNLIRTCYSETRRDYLIIKLVIVAFVKERFHNAVEIDILGIVEGYSSLQIWPPQKNFSGAKLFRANDVISIEHVLCS